MRQAAGALPDRPVRIDDDCWIGTNAVICPGVRVGKGAVIGANAVVTRDVPAYSVVAGAPARRIGDRLAWAPPADIEFAEPRHLPYVTSPVPWDSKGPAQPGQVRAGWPLEAWCAGGAGSVVELHGSSDGDAILSSGGHEHRVGAGPFCVRFRIDGASGGNGKMSLQVQPGGAVRIARITVVGR